MKTTVLRSRTCCCRRERYDSLSKFYFKTGLWMVSPLWVLTELIYDFAVGKGWTHRKGTLMETRYLSVSGVAITFSTTIHRMSWLDEIGYFNSKIFQQKVKSEKKNGGNKRKKKNVQAK